MILAVRAGMGEDLGGTFPFDYSERAVVGDCMHEHMHAPVSLN